MSTLVHRSPVQTDNPTRLGELCRRFRVFLEKRPKILWKVSNFELKFGRKSDIVLTAPGFPLSCP